MKKLKALLIVVAFCCFASISTQSASAAENESIQSLTPINDEYGFLTLTLNEPFFYGWEHAKGNFTIYCSPDLAPSASYNSRFYHEHLYFDYSSSNPNANLIMGTDSPLFDGFEGRFYYSTDAATTVTLSNIRLTYSNKLKDEANQVLYFDGEFKFYIHPESITLKIDNNTMGIMWNWFDHYTEQVPLDVAPYIKENRTFVPIRALTEGFGANVTWTDDNHITIDLNGHSIVMVPGTYNYWIDGELKTMDTVPEIVQDRTFVPVRFVAEALGFEVTPSYDSYGRTQYVAFQYE